MVGSSALPRVLGGLRLVSKRLRALDGELQAVLVILSPGPLTDTNKIVPERENDLRKRRLEAKTSIREATRHWEDIQSSNTFER